jgi:hypothetical protein
MPNDTARGWLPQNIGNLWRERTLARDDIPTDPVRNPIEGVSSANELRTEAENRGGNPSRAEGAAI